MYNLIKAHSMVDFVEPDESTINNVTAIVYSDLATCIKAAQTARTEHYNDLKKIYIENSQEILEGEDGYEEEQEQLTEDFDDNYRGEIDANIKFSDSDRIKYVGYSQYSNEDECDEEEYYIQKI